MPLAFAANLLIARSLGPAGYGIYMTLLSAGLLAAGIAVFGVNRVLIREIARSEYGDKTTMLRNMLHWALRFTSITTLISIVIMLAWLDSGSGAPESDWISRILIGLLILGSLGTLLTAGLLLGLGSAAQSQALDNVIKNGMLLLGMLLLLALGLPVSISSVLGIQVIAFTVAIIIGIIWLCRLRRHFPGAMTNRSVVVNHVVKCTWRRSAVHFFAGSVAILLLGRVDVLLVNALGGNTAAGLFGAANRLGQLAGVGGLVLMSWLQPRFAQAVAAQQGLRIQRLVRHSMLLAFCMTVVAVLIGWVASHWLMQLMGAGFEEAVWPFRWILLAYLVWSLAVPGYALLAMSGHEAALARIGWTQLVITVGLCFLLVPSFGALGGVWAYGAGMTATSLAVLMLLPRITYGAFRN